MIKADWDRQQSIAKERTPCDQSMNIAAFKQGEIPPHENITSTYYKNITYLLLS
jgi:hypothetical protein